MALIGQDSFKDTNNTTLQYHVPELGDVWIVPTGIATGNNVVIHSRSVAYDSSGTGSDNMWLLGGDLIDDGYVQASLFSFVPPIGALICRVNPTFDSYILFGQCSETEFILAGDDTEIITPTMHFGMVARIEFVKSDVNAYLDGVLVASVKSSLVTGYYGFMLRVSAWGV